MRVVAGWPKATGGKSRARDSNPFGRTIIFRALAEHSHSPGSFTLTTRVTATERPLSGTVILGRGLAGKAGTGRWRA